MRERVSLLLVEAEEIVDERSELLSVGAVVSDQLLVMKSLSETEIPFLRFGDARTYMNCAVTNLQAADSSLHWLGQRLSAVAMVPLTRSSQTTLPSSGLRNRITGATPGGGVIPAARSGRQRPS